jgi:hypothetical protein
MKRKEEKSMLVEAGLLLKNIQGTQMEVNNLKEQISNIGAEKLSQVINIALNGLEFKPIYENSYINDEFEEEGECFSGITGEILKGVLVLSSIEDSEGTEVGEREEHKEIFLLDDGKLKMFDTVYEWNYCPDCDANHHTTQRVETDIDEDLCEYRNEVIINNILVKLTQTAEELERTKERLLGRIEKLNSLKVS